MSSLPGHSGVVWVRYMDQGAQESLSFGPSEHTPTSSGISAEIVKGRVEGRCGRAEVKDWVCLLSSRLLHSLAYWVSGPMLADWERSPFVEGHLLLSPGSLLMT